MVHALGVEHADFEPRNVVRKGWCRLRIIDFAFSNVNHTCPGWGVCNELTYAWHKLELDQLTFRHNSGMLRNKFRSVGDILSGIFLVIPLAFIMTFKSVISGDWRV